VVVVVGIKELARLVAVHRDVGTVKIQHDFLRRFLVLLDEVMPQQFMGFDHCLPIHALLHPTQGRFARQNGLFTGRGLKYLVSA